MYYLMRRLHFLPIFLSSHSPPYPFQYVDVFISNVIEIWINFKHTHKKCTNIFQCIFLLFLLLYFSLKNFKSLLFLCFSILTFKNVAHCLLISSKPMLFFLLSSFSYKTFPFTWLSCFYPDFFPFNLSSLTFLPASFHSGFSSFFQINTIMSVSWSKCVIHSSSE